jgi:outer membrane protein OmpA-like peptidoglycan-associated protein
MKKIIFMLLVSAFMSLIPARLVADVGVPFLQMSPSPRASALGDAYLSQSDYADAIYYNPASSVFIPNLNFSGSYSRWIGDINYFSIFTSFPVSSTISLGEGLTGLSVNDTHETRITDLGEIALTGNSIAAYDFCGFLNCSWQFYPGFSTGANIKFISQSISSVKSFVFGSDIGLFYKLKHTNLRSGFVVQNLGTTAKFVSENTSLPLSVKFGSSYDVVFSQEHNPLKNILLTAQVKRTAGENISASCGIEFLLWDIAMLRSGYEYQPNGDSSGFKTGLGINLNKFMASDVGLQINYGLDFFKTLGITQTFQLNTSFLSSPKKVPAIPKIVSIPSITLQGRITNVRNGSNLNAHVIVQSVKNTNTKVQVTSDPVTGLYSMILPAGNDFWISAEADNFMFYSERMSLVHLSNSSAIQKDFGLHPLKPGEMFIVETIYFDGYVFTLRKESKIFLDKFLAMLNAHPKLRFAINGYVAEMGFGIIDSQWLSERRAAVVKKYLTDRGISDNRLEARGYGGKKPIGKNTTAEGRQENRRTEFEILPFISEIH